MKIYEQIEKTALNVKENEKYETASQGA